MCRYDISGGIPNINTGERPRRLYSSFQVVFRGQVILSTDQILIVRGNSEEIATLTHGYSWIKESRISSPIQISINSSVLRPNIPNHPILSVEQPRN